MLAGENVSALARELKVLRKDLYVWRDRFRSGGPDALRGRGRPPKSASASVVRGTTTKPAISLPDAASKRIAELERKIGQQQVELDFFRQALRQVKGARWPGLAAPVTIAVGPRRALVRKRPASVTQSNVWRSHIGTTAIAGSRGRCAVRDGRSTTNACCA
jgi:transposase